ncbi:hypothetical protein [Vibrio furnissii]|uniref:hypothetical protein n=1 Tax=Vibrio furnissii TaxID=29494 RepID=UPI003752E1D9
MPDSFSPEIKVVNAFRKYLESGEWDIIQLVCSGGQAHFSVSYKHDGKNKTVFPDVVAIKENVILIGEIKENFSLDDQNKLLEMQASALVDKRLKKNLSLRRSVPECLLSVEYVLIHSNKNNMFPSKIKQIICTDNSYIVRLPNEEN